MNSEVKENRPDAELARLAAEGDAAAFEEIHSRYRNLVYRIAMRMTRNEADAEDLTQDSFVLILRRVGSFRGESSFTSWLYRLVVNQVRMHFRRRKSRPEDLTGDGEIRERGHGLARRGESDRVIDRLAIKEAARRLPPGYRTAFILHDVEGYEHEEVGRITGWAAGTSKSQLHRARLSLRKLLASQSPALQN
jgi:RNA polymerase sigma-70 factor (ECF subfamily)